MKRTGQWLGYLAAAALMLLLVPSSVWAGDDSDSDSDERTPVGAWTVQFTDDVSPTGDNTLIEQFHLGGTLSGAAWSDSLTNTAGSWAKSGENRYRATVYVMIPAAGGYVKAVRDFRMVGRNGMQGREEGWWVPGKDPLAGAFGPIWSGELTFRRIR